MCGACLPVCLWPSEHFQNDHHLCPHPSCLEKKFVVFNSEHELKRHFAGEHGDELKMSRAQRREALTIPINLQWSTGGSGAGGWAWGTEGAGGGFGAGLLLLSYKEMAGLISDSALVMCAMIGCATFAASAAWFPHLMPRHPPFTARHPPCEQLQ